MHCLPALLALQHHPAMTGPHVSELTTPHLLLNDVASAETALWCLMHISSHARKDSAKTSLVNRTLANLADRHINTRINVASCFA